MDCLDSSWHDVARANGLAHVSGSTGSTSEKAVITRYDLPEIALMDMGDFVGGMLKYMRRNPVANLTIAGGFAKMAKLGQGAIDLHSARSQVDFTALADLATACDYDYDIVAHANSVLDVVQQEHPKCGLNWQMQLPLRRKKPRLVSLRRGGEYRNSSGVA